MRRPGGPKKFYTYQEVDKSLNRTAQDFMANANHPVFSGTGFADIDAHLNRIALSTPSPTVKEVMEARGNVPFSQEEFKNRLKGNE